MVVALLNDEKSKPIIEQALVQLFNNNSLDIPSLVSSVGGLLDSLKGFDPTKDLTVNSKNYYNDGQGDIAKSIQLTVLGPNGNDGWLTASGSDKKAQLHQIVSKQIYLPKKILVKSLVEIVSLWLKQVLKSMIYTKQQAVNFLVKS
ncbi:hypothetical protein [Spiroplasma endosymbiont of Nebria brevicollis]|uniref:hypothetical protein n=1 Tax=Spiroplasma endosymbiont of Nebria brevicollis TaxID=3066284 RepID=UPI00313C990E